MANNPPFNGSEGGPIALTIVTRWKKNYFDQQINRGVPKDEVMKGHFFGMDIIQKILNQPGCMGIRVYYALNEDMEKRVILLGAKADHSDMDPGNGESVDGNGNTAANFSVDCPPICPGNGQ